MTKYSFVLFHKDVEGFLSNLQELGVVDLTRQKRSIDNESKEQFEQIALCNHTIKTLSTIKEDELKKGGEIPSNKAIESISGLDFMLLINKKLALKEELKTSALNLKTELLESQPWGEFSNESLKKLGDINITPQFYFVSEKIFDNNWENEYPLYILNRQDGKVYFTILSNYESFKYAPAKFPERSASVIEKDIDELKVKIDENNRELLSYSNYINKLNDYKNILFGNLDLYLAKSASKKEAEQTIVIFEGFAPTEIDSTVDKFLQESNVYYLKADARREDNPPIKLKNNFFGKLYEPIGELYMLPTYGELDLTVYFAPFYMLFFGLCLGDMGYGLILILGGLFVNFKMPKFSNYGKLVAWLGLGAVIMPALNGTFFGAKIYDIIPMPDNITQLFFSDMKMFWFAIIFGLVQIVFARLLNAAFRMKTIGFTAGLSNIGWSIAITWAAFWYYYNEIGATLPQWSTYVGLFGLALIVFFSSDSKNILARTGKGIFSLYDATGVFGDMLSYIRLFGLGTAGGILGLVVNSVAIQMQGIPYIGWFFMLIMLLVGHTAVLFLSCLGAFVHPMRLTFVEFYKNAGFEGGGREYPPIRKNKH